MFRTVANSDNCQSLSAFAADRKTTSTHDKKRREANKKQPRRIEFIAMNEHSEFDGDTWQIGGFYGSKLNVCVCVCARFISGPATLQ